ncbi:MAG: hypothetical protein ABIP68_04730 [Ferruginibacter sp.]
MSTLITHSLEKNNKINGWLLAFMFAVLSIFPIYKNFYYSNGLLTYERHKALLEGNSEFYNPWQYRVLSPYMVEGVLWIYNHTIDKIYPIEQKLHFTIDSTSGTNEQTSTLVKLMQTPGAMKYMIVFVMFRFMQHFLIFYLVYRFWKYFVSNTWLLLLGISFLALAFGNAVTAADLSFNTYTDIILYTLTALLIVYKWNPLWLLPIIILSAFNRETGLMMPALYFISLTDFTRFNFRKFNVKEINFPPLKTWIYVSILYIIFFSIFIALRIHFEYREQQVWKVPSGLPMLKLNLFSAVGFKAYLELIGTFAIIPIIILYKFKRFPELLRKWFLFLVPIWFAIHYISVVAYQTRLFMVPMILIMLPMVLWLIEKSIQTDYINRDNKIETI